MNFLVVMSLSSLLCVAVIGVLRLKHLCTEMRLLSLFFSISLILSIFQLVLALKSVNNLWLQHVYTLAMFCFYVVVMSYWQINKKTARLLSRHLIIGFIFVWIFSKFSLENFRHFDVYTSGLAYIVILTLVCYTMFVLAKTTSSKFLGDYRFWVLSGVLISSISSTVVISSGNLVLNLTPDQILQLWRIHWVTLTVAHILYSIAFLLKQSDSTVQGTTLGSSFRPVHDIAVWFDRRTAARREPYHHGSAQSAPRPGS